ncbi:phosphatidate cytidylyltransferase [Sulfobacillus thermosulfidooxidans DSM 9293]|uniref:Phosphatidate cytidylyltransferase n=1 Tax=Sulfobacillus thermosulfidooxidans (strain DSM 9293 / VKM B-1269 / AT-1) TaxID=929705 RepID=A0A1W1WLH1_SULTA|nr:phosphatidate cytidylyltransferase [Sulfobacillus thermosulfidooxidans]SMC06573.1 phosphatidate cytidylyltransferase [Sulfobacillus thermosulfidooxidans DSM 9293]
MLGLRILTATFGIPVIILLVYLGGWFLVAGVAILAAIGVVEIHRMFHSRGIVFYPWLAILWIWSLLTAVGLGKPLMSVLVLGVAIVAIVALLSSPQESLQGAVTTTWVALYVGLFFAFLPLIREMVHGQFLAYTFFAVIWTTDTMAFFVGRRFGKHKLMPRVSPGKTWEGTVGGTIGGTVVAIGAFYLMHAHMVDGLIFGLVISVMGQIGDLLESAIKRYSGVKDSGGLLPGHGGVLDRFDSSLLTLPIAYYLLRGLGIH